MAEYLTRDLKLGISKAVESSYNTMRTGNSDLYLGMLTTTKGIYIPDKEKYDDTGKIGTGQEFPTEQRSGYIAVPSLEIAEELNIDVGAVLFRRCLGGSVTVAAVTDSTATLGAQNQSFGMLPNSSGRQLPSSTVLWSLGGADYMWGGVVIDQFKIDQSNSNIPTFTATLVGSGLNKRLRYLTANGALAVNGSNAYNGPYAGSTSTEYPPSFPIPTVQRYMNGAESKLSFTDTTGAYVVTNAQLLKTFALTVSNNHRTDDRRPGDPRVDSGNQTSGDPRSGHYTNRMLHGDRTVAADMTVMLNDTMREFTDAYTDDVITSFTYTAAGDLVRKSIDASVVSTSDNQYEFETSIAKCYFRSIKGQDNNGDATINITVFPVYDGTNPVLAARILTNTATTIV